MVLQSENIEEEGKRPEYQRCFLKRNRLTFLKPADSNQTQIVGTSPLGKSWGILCNLDVRPKTFHTPLIPKAFKCGDGSMYGKVVISTKTAEPLGPTSNLGRDCGFRLLWE